MNGPGTPLGAAEPAGQEGARSSRSPLRRVARVGGLTVLAIVVLGVAVLLIGFPRQTVSYLTHWKGGPARSVPYAPFEPEPPLHLAVVGDSGDSGTGLDRTAAAVAAVGDQQPFDLLLLLGDNVYPDGDPERLDETVFTPFSPVLDQDVDLAAILGNHDVLKTDGSAQMEALGMEGRYWATDLGDVLLIGLDSNTIDDPRQLDWLEETLRSSDDPWKIVAIHHPPYSAGYQGSSLEVRRVLSPLMEEYGVQLVLSGHDHDYQRSESIDGVTYVVSGAGSGSRRTGEDEFTAMSFSWLHFLDIAVYPDHLVLRPVSDELRVGDELVLER